MVQIWQLILGHPSCGVSIFLFRNSNGSHTIFAPLCTLCNMFCEHFMINIKPWPVKFHTSHVSTVPNINVPFSAAAFTSSTFSRSQESFVAEKYVARGSPHLLRRWFCPNFFWRLPTCKNWYSMWFFHQHDNTGCSERKDTQNLAQTWLIFYLRFFQQPSMWSHHLEDLSITI